MTGHGCSRESLEGIQRLIQEKNLNRVVIGGCSPRTHETLFQDTVRKAGLNKYLVEMANIRDQDTWVHLDQPDDALNKGKDLIRMAVSAVALAHPLTEHVLPMNKNILVVGGGVAGMNAALALADQGFRVYLAERSAALGGVAADIRKTLEGEDVQAYLKALIERTTAPRQHPGSDPIRHRGSQRHARPFQDRAPGGPPDVLPANHPWRHHSGDRRGPEPASGIPAGRARRRGDAARPGSAPRRRARESESLATGGHDPVRRLPVSGKPQLLPHLLSVGRQERLEAARSEPPRSRSLSSTGTCGPTGFRRTPIETPGSGGSFSSAMKRRTSLLWRPMGPGWRCPLRIRFSGER